MRLLIVTQVVDTEDPVLGFFVRWIEEFAKYTEHIEVICLKEGRHTFPANVRVHSLGKETHISRVKYIFHFYKYVWDLRHEYDTVFVHMNPEYLLLAGWLWRLWNKRIALWYTHKTVDLKLRIAVSFVHTVFTASSESFRLKTKKLHVMGHGIDGNFFFPDPAVLRGTAVLSAGRLSPTKRHDLVISAAAHFPNEVWIVGNGPERQRLENLAENLSITERVHFLGPQTQEQLRKEYREACVFLHVSETGSLDKVVLEALSCGLPVITTAITLSDLPVTVVPSEEISIAEEVLAAHNIDPQSLFSYVQEHHSLQKLIPTILKEMQTI